MIRIAHVCRSVAVHPIRVFRFGDRCRFRCQTL